MSSLSQKHRAMAEKVFRMENGYVLRFTKRGFHDFVILSIGIDIYNDKKYLSENSEAKKLRYIFNIEPDSLVGKLLLDLLDKRKIGIESKIVENDEYVDHFATYAKELETVAGAMQAGVFCPTSDIERLNVQILTAKTVLNDLIQISGYLCSNYIYNQDTHENSINDYYRDMLRRSGYSKASDQTRHGISSSGKDAGEVDILLEKDGQEIAIFEGLKLSSVDQGYIKEHINKAVVNYNALGTATYIAAYVGAANFGAFWENYVDYLQKYQYPLVVKSALAQQVNSNAAIRVANMILSRDEFDFPVFFMAVNVRK